MWVKFWHNDSRNEPPDDSDDCVWKWHDKDESDEMLEDAADELVPEWRKGCEHYYYGFSRKDPPGSVRTGLIRMWKGRKAYAERMLLILEAPEVYETHTE